MKYNEFLINYENSKKLIDKVIAFNYAKKLQKIELIKKDKAGLCIIEDNEIVDRIKRLFADALDLKMEEISLNAHFFFDLNGSSLDYFSLLSSFQAEFGINFPHGENESFYTVAEFLNYILKIK